MKQHIKKLMEQQELKVKKRSQNTNIIIVIIVIRFVFDVILEENV